MRTELLRFNGAVERDPAIDAWMKEHAGELGDIARRWFVAMRKCGDEVRELLHDGCPGACLGDAPFGYVNVFTSHVNVGFFHGASPKHATGQPSCKSSRTSSPHFRITSNHCCAIAPSSPACSFIHASMAGFRS